MRAHVCVRLFLSLSLSLSLSAPVRLCTSVCVCVWERERWCVRIFGCWHAHKSVCFSIYPSFSAFGIHVQTLQNILCSFTHFRTYCVHLPLVSDYLSFIPIEPSLFSIVRARVRTLSVETRPSLPYHIILRFFLSLFLPFSSSHRFVSPTFLVWLFATQETKVSFLCARASSYSPIGASVWGLKLLVYEALSY